METAVSGEPGGQDTSIQSCRFQLERKDHIHHVVQENRVDSSGNILACLQVFGSFFLMVNSWYIAPALF